MSYLQLVSVRKHYSANGSLVHALEDVNLSVEQGEFVAIVGPSGAGKSTLLQIVAGLEPPSSGQVLLEGRPVTHWGAERTLISQRPNLFPWLTALGNVAFGLRMAGLPPDESAGRAGQALARMGLSEAAGLYPHELSGGMQQRVALARALVLDPAILLMDEPLASVDALLRARLQREIHAACVGRTVLYVTHSIREALTLAHRVVILSPIPGRVCREYGLQGVSPRTISPHLARIEAEIEEALLGA